MFLYATVLMQDQDREEQITSVRADCPSTLTDTLNHLHDVAHLMGLRFNKDKTEVFHWSKHYAMDNLSWQHRDLPVHPPVMTYPATSWPTPRTRKQRGRW